jgi:mRNA interferase HicA
LKARAARSSPARGGHLKVKRHGKMSVLPMHGAGKEIGKGLENRIKKDLGLK